jgi:hypothetical protein
LRVCPTSNFETFELIHATFFRTQTVSSKPNQDPTTFRELANLSD